MWVRCKFIFINIIGASILENNFWFVLLISYICL